MIVNEFNELKNDCNVKARYDDVLVNHFVPIQHQLHSQMLNGTSVKMKNVNWCPKRVLQGKCIKAKE